jgi:hypothetical protein
MDDEVAHTQRYPSVRTDERGALRQPLECRGQFFRSAYLTLGRQCGTSWLVQVGGESAILARLVRPSTPADGWHATDLLGMLLQRSQGHEKARREASLLREAPEVWNRFFRGSTLAVDELGAASIRVTVDPGPGNRLVCALIEGWLMRLVELVGASSVLPEHPQHAVGAGGPCRFALRWE